MTDGKVFWLRCGAMASGFFIVVGFQDQPSPASLASVVSRVHVLFIGLHFVSCIWGSLASAPHQTSESDDLRLRCLISAVPVGIEPLLII
jgi:hypothetical protein